MFSGLQIYKVIVCAIIHWITWQIKMRCRLAVADNV